MEVLTLTFPKTPYWGAPVLAPFSVSLATPLTGAAPLQEVLLAVIRRVVKGALGGALPTVTSVPIPAPYCTCAFIFYLTT